MLVQYKTIRLSRNVRRSINFQSIIFTLTDVQCVYVYARLRAFIMSPHLDVFFLFSKKWNFSCIMDCILRLIDGCEYKHCRFVVPNETIEIC